MTRWGPDSRGRLREAAMELFRKRGYGDTTVADIARRAGVTERTFFRHYTDKREVLFAGSDDLRDLIINAVMSAPRSVSPIEAVAVGLDAAWAVFNDERREFSQQRQRIIAANAELRERELIKLAALTDAIAEALHRRGVPDTTANLAAEAGMGVFRVAFERWLDPGNDKSWKALVADSVARLKQLV